MEIENLAQFLGFESNRLDESGIPRSQITMSSYTDSGKVAKMTLIVEIQQQQPIMREPPMQQQQPQQQPMQHQMPPQQMRQQDELQVPLPPPPRPPQAQQFR
jgi:hypothetical protein